MEKVNYANMANELLGNEMYSKFIKEISKDNKGKNLVDFGKEVLNKCCFLIVMLGMSKKIKLDNIKICLDNEVIKIPCKEFALKYEKYVNEIENNINKTIYNVY